MIQKKIASLLFVCLLAPAFAFAQTYPEPASVAEPAVLCTECPGTNALGETNDGKPLYPYDVPLVDHVGRLVDSSAMQNVQNAGMRTLRARAVRIRPSRDRIYVQLGETIAAYTLSTFFTTTLAMPPVSVTTIDTGSIYFRPGTPETLAKPDAHFYAESDFSGWTTAAPDAQIILKDFDTDDRGYLYVSTVYFGWGIALDDGRTDGKHLPFVAQFNESWGPDILFSLKHGDEYSLVMSGPREQGVTTSARVLNVTNPSTPTGRSRPMDTTGGIVRWAKFEAGERVAVINGDGSLRIYTNAGLVAGTAPLETHAPSGGKKFNDLSFDDDGTLWVAESTVSPAANVLWKLAPAVATPTYTKTTHDVYGSAFAPERIHASAGYVAVGGRGPDPADATAAFDLRLLDASSGTPQLIPTDNFFRRHYHRAPAGYAQPKASQNYVQLRGVHLVRQNGLDYLLYSAEGLGDVYELGEVLRPPQLKATSISPTTGPPAGGTVVTISGRNFGQDSVVTFDNVAAATTFVSSTTLTAVAPKHAPGSVDVTVSSGGQSSTLLTPFSYFLAAPTALSAIATSTTSVTMTWTGVAAATQYEIWRWNGVEFLPIGTTPNLTFTDPGRTPDTAYVYRVHSMDDDANRSAPSLRNIATTMLFTDTAITPGTRIEAVHVLELRKAINLVRAAAGLSATSFEGTVAPGQIVRSAHMSPLRSSLQSPCNLLSVATAFVTEGPTLGGAIRASLLQEILSVVR
jgi:hypothetical protein